MALPLPPPAPQRGDRTTFSSRVDAFLTWLAALVPQLNVMTASLSSFVAGGAYAIPYVVDLTVAAAADPGNGMLRFSSLSQSSSTSLYVDTQGLDSKSYSAVINGFSASTSASKGTLRLVSAQDATKFLVFDLNSVATNSGYFTFTVTPRGSSTDSPFGSGESILMYFQRTGDKGDQGAVSGMPSQSQLLSTIDTVPVVNGGTGSKTAPGALTNLGALPAAGGNVTGSLSFANGGTGIAFKDAGNTSRAFAFMDAANNMVLSNAGGTKLNIYNQALNAIRWSIDDIGTVSQTGPLIFPNGVPIRMADAGGTSRVFAQVASNNDVQLVNIGGANWTIYNQAATQIILNLTNNGVLTAPVITATSDERKKTNWRSLSDAQLDALANMTKVGVFEWVDGSGLSVGGSAQQIRAIVPEAVHEDAKGELSVQYGGLCFAIQQATLRRLWGAK